MQRYSPTASGFMAAPAGGRRRSREPDDLVYHAVTIAAILLVLASLCLF
jgi:hypothetical protein